MKTVLSFLLFVSIGFAAQAQSPEGARQWNSEHIAWMSYDEGVAQAQSTGRPIVMVMHTTWCGWCKKYRRQFYDAEVVALAANLVMILVDRDAEPDVQRRYAGTGGYIPRTLGLTRDGLLDPSIVGSRRAHPFYLDVREPDEVIKFMRDIILRHPVN